jgi:sugar phosphate isomerase/epimerase
MDQTIATSLPWTSYVSMKDVTNEGGRDVFKLPGETGQIDYAALIRQFYAGGYRGDFNCEISSVISKKSGYDGIETAKKCYANIAPAFVAAGVQRVKRA